MWIELAQSRRITRSEVHVAVGRRGHSVDVRSKRTPRAALPAARLDALKVAALECIDGAVHSGRKQGWAFSDFDREIDVARFPRAGIDTSDSWRIAVPDRS